MSVHRLKIVQLNSNSIVRIERRACLLDFLKRHDPDILLLCETKLNKTHKITLKSYNIIRTDRKNAKIGGGTAIIIKNHLKYKKITLSTLSEFKCIETTIIGLNLQNGNRMLLISAYSPMSSQPIFKEEFQKLFEQLSLHDTANYYILAGDFNAKHTNWLNPNNNPRGVFINSWIENNHIDYKCKLYSSTVPTYPRGNSFLDICFSDARIKIICENIHDRSDDRNIITGLPVLPYDSDHYAISMTCSIENDTQFILDRTPEKLLFDFGRTDWKKLQKKLTSVSQNNKVQNSRNMTNGEIDQCIDMIDRQIETAIEQVVPKFKKSDNMSAFSNPTIRRLQQQKSKLVSEIFLLYRTNQHNSPQFNILKSILKNLKTLIKQQYNLAINDYWMKKIGSISQKDSYNMFPQINKIFRKKSRECLPDFKLDARDSILDDANVNRQEFSTQNNECLVANDVDKLEIIGRHFESVHRQNANLSNLDTRNLVQQKIIDFEANHVGQSVTNFSITKKADMLSYEQTEDYFTTLENLKTVFGGLNNKKSYGLDNIPNVVLKHIPDCIISQYCIIFNNALNNTYFPSKWKTAKVYPIKKRDKDTSRYDSYRPISLLPNVSKVYEIIINQAIQRYCNDHAVIPNCQYGFRRHHSTVHAIAKFTSDCCWHLNSKLCIGACLIDLEKAFDTVWREGLIYKLILTHFPPHIIKLTQDMISGRRFIVTNGETTTDTTFEVQDGLQQGTVNSPILFSIFISDLLRSFDFNVTASNSIIAFADDIIIYTADKTVGAIQGKLQTLFNNTLTYFHQWKMKANLKKCETILIRPPLRGLLREVQRNWKGFRISAGGNTQENIPHKTVVRYLGVYIDQYLHLNDHITTRMDNANKAFCLLRRLLFNRNLSAMVKVMCYKSIIRPILTYGAPIWFNLCPSYMEKYRVLERKILRMCIGGGRASATQYKHYINNTTLYTLSDTERVDLHILKLVRNHCARSSLMIEENDNIWQPYYPQALYLEKTLKTGYIPPEMFIHLDTNGYIQDDQGIPILYHIYRHPTHKGIEHGKFDLDRSLLRFSTSVKHELQKNKIKYWWLLPE